MDDSTLPARTKTYLIADTTVELLKGRLAAELGKTPKTLRYDLKMCKPSNKNTGKCVWLVSAWARRTEVDSQGEKHTYQNEAGAFYVVMMPEGATKVRVALASVDQGVDDIRAARGDYDASLTVWGLTRRIDWNQIRPPEHPGAALLAAWLEEADAAGNLTRVDRAQLTIVRDWAAAQGKGMTQAEYCASEGIEPDTLRGWRDKYAALGYETNWPDQATNRKKR